MDNYKLGDLPEALRAWAKFRPVDILDFKRRAKNLSEVLKLPLQKTQDAFALACGYSGRHEIQQVLAQPGTPGPYDDDIPAELLDQIRQAQAIVQFYRHERLLSAVEALIEVIPQRYFDNRDGTVCDLDLFSTPYRHRISAKATVEFLSGEGSGCTFDGFPYGYRGEVHRYLSLEATQFDEESLQELVAGWILKNPNEQRLFDPREQARAQLRFRAPMLFTAMADETAAPLVVEPHELHLDYDDLFEDDSETSRLLLNDVDFCIAYQLSDVDADVDGELERLQVALRSPTQDNVNASSVASSIANFADQIPRWRLSLRYQQAKQLRNPDYFGWGSEEAECTVLLDSHMRDGGFGPEAVPDGPLRWLSVCMEKDDVDLSQVHWKVTATLLLQDSKGTPWKAVAFLTGDHIIAAKNGRYSGPDDVELHCDDYGNSRLSEAWKLLAKLYIPVAGYLSYHEWVNNDWDGGGVV